MMKTTQNIIDKYYRGETSVEEELRLKKTNFSEKENPVEKDIFEYLESQSQVPRDIEETVFNAVSKHINKHKKIKMRNYRVASVAASLLILVGIYTGFQRSKQNKIENDFLAIEQALFQVSENIKPAETDDMFVLWVDDDVEIIIN